jgi:flagellar biosynthesis GTPase FlhF
LLAREEAMNAKITANKLTFQRIEDARKVEEAEKREEIARTIAEEEKAKSEMAMRRAETAIQLAEKEAQQRRDAELRATMESEERKKAQEALAFTPPNHFFCPILQEVMDEPYVAADGFTYEYRTIKTWLENNNTSPMTNLSLSHKYLVPNHSLRSAILEWKTKSGFNCSDF